jgi:hypothetical protein
VLAIQNTRKLILKIDDETGDIYRKGGNAEKKRKPEDKTVDYKCMFCYTQERK